MYGELPTWLLQHREFIYAFLLLFLFVHFVHRFDGPLLVLCSLITTVAAFAFVAFMYEPTIYISDVALFTAAYGVTLYIFLCEILQQWLAKWLTKKRGEKWVKEMDYFYLAFGLVGILGAVNKIDQISGRFSKADVFAPLVLVTAVVIRFIKTRAEIAGWNKS